MDPRFQFMHPSIDGSINHSLAALISPNSKALSGFELMLLGDNALSGFELIPQNYFEVILIVRGVLERLGASWNALGALLGCLGALLGRLGALLGHLGCSWGASGRSWGVLGRS